MHPLQRFSEAVVSAVNPIFSELKGAFSGHRNVDCVFIVGPELEASVERFQRIARAEGLSYVVIGDGKNPITEKMISDARKSGVIGPETEVFCNFHGGFRGAPENGQTGLSLDEQSHLVSPAKVISWLRGGDSAAHDKSLESPSWGGNIHLLTCHAGKFRDELRPSPTGEPCQWEQGAIFLHGSGKVVYDEAGFDSTETVIREIALSIRLEGKRPDNIQIMRALMDTQADSITLIGGALTAPLVMHAPQSVTQVLHDNLSARWLQEDAEKRLDLLQGRVSGADQQRRDLMNARSVSGKDKYASKSSKHVFKKRILNVLFTRFGHLKSEDKLQKLVDDLSTHPDLLQARGVNGETPLHLYCSLPYDKSSAVRRHDVVPKLLQLGADINAKDRFGRTAIHFAAQSGDVRLFDVLVSAGADPSALDSHGNSVFHYLARSSHPVSRTDQMLERLAQAKADGVSVANIRGKNKAGKSALDVAMQPGAQSGLAAVFTRASARPVSAAR